LRRSPSKFEDSIWEDLIIVAGRYFNVTRLFRLMIGKTQDKVAEEAGVHRMTVWALEKYGLSSDPSYREQQERIIALYGKTPDELGASFPSHLAEEYAAHRESIKGVILGG